QGVTLQKTVFVHVDDTQATFETHTMNEEGIALAPPATAVSSWEEFRTHASFPSELTKIDEREIDTPLGQYRSMVYHVSSDDSPDTRFYFVKELAGPPLRVSLVVDEQETVIMEMIARE
ncbi:MAG: hypothetical protein AAFQ82_20165, partial [Myxococcota bacterium]